MPYPVERWLTDSLNHAPARMQLRPPCASTAALQQQLQTLPVPLKVTPSGSRMSQGGQSLLDGALAMDLDLLQRVEVLEAKETASVRIEAGALWDHLHRSLVQHEGRRWAPCTHQSSPWFSVGGSLAVNCHGRDPRQGPLAASVQALEVMDAQGQILVLDESSELFHAVLGGYGALGVITSAQLRLKPECSVRVSVSNPTPTQLLDVLQQRLSGAQPQPVMHHAFALFDRGPQMFGEFIQEDGWPIETPPTGELVQENFVTDDLAAWLYDKLRQAPDHPTFWALLKTQRQGMDGHVDRQINLMRAPVRFTLMKGVQTADILQEYFLPMDGVAGFLDDARDILNGTVPDRVKLLSCTLRTVNTDPHARARPWLAYAADAPRISIVFNMNVRHEDLHDTLDLPEGASSAVALWTRNLIEAALGRKGSFYLPYGRHATVEQFRRAYPRWNDFRQLRRSVDPGLRFDNRFLQAYGL